MDITRRTFVKALALGAAFGLAESALGATQPPAMRAIPSSGEQFPAIGLGSWITFTVGDDPVPREENSHAWR